MRWQNLSIDGAQQAALPGYREPATIRHFDAPEALETEFYEIRARSALNRVHAKSRVPFRWTINPYRGCSHGCSYCVAGHTPTLMGDGSIGKMEDLVVGDVVYGTRVEGRHRRYVRTEVLDRWISLKPAYRTLLEDGTELITSGDHRFLTERGWKHVVPGSCCQRPFLTTNNSLIGVGRLAPPPAWTDEYRRGYLCGMLRGDANLARYEYQDASGRRVVHRFRLALAATAEFAFAGATERRRAMRAIRTCTKANFDRIRDLVAWPQSPGDDWRKGFLAGIFDAEGSCSGSALAITNKDTQILDWLAFCLRRFGFDFRVEPVRPTGCRSVRLRGGLKERLRFFHLVDPAITRKRDFEGMALKSDARLRVVSIEPLGVVLPLYDITTGTGDYISNGVVSHNCFARPTHTYLDFDAGRDFETRIVVKVNAPEVLRAELRRPSWRREHVAMGTNTDPYQWCESKYRLMPPIWEALRDFRTPASILTKSPLLLRDLDLLRSFGDAGVPVQASFSVPTLEEKAWRASEPHTPHPRKRLEAVGELTRAGIPTGILVAPLMPGINDDPRQVERILEIAGEMGAVSVGGICLHLRGEVKKVFMDWLRSYRPDLVERYEELYARGAYAAPDERARIAGLVRYARRGPAWREVVQAAETPATPPTRPRAIQESLF